MREGIKVRADMCKVFLREASQFQGENARGYHGPRGFVYGLFVRGVANISNRGHIHRSPVGSDRYGHLYIYIYIGSVVYRGTPYKCSCFTIRLLNVFQVVVGK